MGVASLGYLHISEQQGGAWRDFGTNVLGLMNISRREHPNTTFLKADQAPFRIMVSTGEDRLVAAGWEMASKQDYQAQLAKLEAAGIALSQGSEQEAAERCVTEFSRCQDPAGNQLEVYHGRNSDADCDQPFESPQGIAEFVTGDMGLGHVVLPAAGCEDETRQFYIDLLGFGDSDDLRLPPPAEGAPEMRVIFLHANNPRHHSVALFNGPSPVGCVHMMLEVTHIDEVGACLDRVNQADMPLLASLGRHCNDNMLSFYVVAPGGIAVEFGYDGLQLDWNDFTPTSSTVGDVWGHAYQVP